jgi:hypothetical protein
VTFLERLVIAIERIADHVAPSRPAIKHSRFTVASTEGFEQAEQDRLRRRLEGESTPPDEVPEP